MDLSIIIVNWNTKKLLFECLESIYKNTKEIALEIIVIDNASADGSAEMIKRNYTKVNLIKSDINLGFARANNIAFEHTTGRYILLLNSDTVVKEKALDLAVSFLDQNKRVGALTPMILNDDESIQHPCYIKDPSLISELYDAFELTRLFGIKRLDSIPAQNTVCNVLHACGCSLFLRKEAIDKVGYLDERMIFSYEDADICFRIRKNGWIIQYYPESKIIHYGGASRSKHKRRAVDAMLKSKYVYYGKYHSSIYIYAISIILILSSSIKLIIYYMLLFNKSTRDKTKIKIYYYIAIIKWHFTPLRNRTDHKGMS